MNLFEIIRRFPTQQECIRHLEKVRWNDQPICTYCQSNKITQRHFSLRYQCNSCNKSFSVTVGTIFHNTRIPMQKWFFAISLVLDAKKGISSRQLARNLDLPVKTAWSVACRIRKAMADDGQLLSGVIEMDETYIGGKPRKPNQRGKDVFGGNKAKRGRGTDKTPVVGIVERDGRVIAKVFTKAMLGGDSLQELVRKRVNVKKAFLVTDEYPAYNVMEDLIYRQSVNHKIEYVAEGGVHTNTIEGFWAMLKRGIIGQYHKVSEKYLDRYLDEFCYRYSNRHRDSDVVFGDTLGRFVATVRP